MKAIDYLKYSNKQEFMLRLDWLFTFFTIQDKGMKPNQYLRVTNNKFEVNVNNGWEELEDARVGEPIFKILENLIVTKDMIKNIKSDTESTIGRVLSNKILLEYPL